MIWEPHDCAFSTGDSFLHRGLFSPPGTLFSAGDSFLRGDYFSLSPRIMTNEQLTNQVASRVVTPLGPVVTASFEHASLWCSWSRLIRTRLDLFESTEMRSCVKRFKSGPEEQEFLDLGDMLNQLDNTRSV